MGHTAVPGESAYFQFRYNVTTERHATRAWITLRDELGRALSSEWTTGISVDGEEWLAFNGDFEFVQSTALKAEDSFALSIHLTAPDSIDPDYGAGDEILADKFNHRADSETDL